MCTVSYVPTKTGYVLTSNRDEDPNRPTQAPKPIHLGNGTTVTAPVDEEKGGTWIATDGKGRTACLLNGGLQKHQRATQYRKSRGAMVLEAFEEKDFETFCVQCNLEGMEPFTLILVTSHTLKVLIWDGSTKHFKNLSNRETALWSSVTLYTPEEHQQKRLFFESGIQAVDTHMDLAEQLLNLHGKGGDSPFLLNRPQVRTVSITQVRSIENHSTMAYSPLKTPISKTKEMVSLKG